MIPLPICKNEDKQLIFEIMQLKAYLHIYLHVHLFDVLNYKTQFIADFASEDDILE